MPLKRSDKWVSGLKPIVEQGSNPKDELGVLKLPLILISPTASALQALCMADGEEKYGPYNYRISKVQARIYLEALRRHLDALIDGQDFDSRTGKPHIGYVLATAQIFADAWINGNLLDNRPLPGKAGLLIDAFSRDKGDPELTPREIQERILRIIHPESEGIRSIYEVCHAYHTPKGGNHETGESQSDHASGDAAASGSKEPTVRPFRRGLLAKQRRNKRRRRAN